MKTFKQSIPQEEAFVPFNLVITIETAAEEEALWNIMNHAWVLEAAKFFGGNSGEIRACLKDYGSFEKFDKKLLRIFKERR